MPAIGNYIGVTKKLGGISWSSYWATRTPTDIVMTILTDTSVRVDWTDAVEAADGLKIYFNDVLKDTVAFGVETSTVTVVLNTAYTIKVVAYKNANESDPLTGNITWSHWMQYSYTDKINTQATWTSAQKLLILGRLQESYIITTFGPAGTNKTTCDFFMFLQVNSNKLAHDTKTITKTGATLRWNYGGGNIYDQNNLPAQTSTNEVSVTSTDGFGGITRFDIGANGWVGNVFNIPYYLPNVTWLDVTGTIASGWYMSADMTGWQFKETATRIYLFQNNFTGDLTSTHIPDSCTQFYIYQNRFTGTIPVIRNTHVTTYSTYRLYDNRFTTIPVNQYSVNMGQYAIYDNYLTTATITSFISDVWDYYNANTPVENLSIVITGAFNGTITDGEANADVVALRADFASHGKSFTLTYNPSTYLLTPLDTPTLVVTTDDDFLTDYSKILPMLSVRGKVATSYRYAYFTGAGHQTITEVNALVAAGWSIEAHPGFSAGDDEAAIRGQMDGFISFFTTNSIPAFNHASYQAGYSNALIKSIMPDYVDTARVIMNWNTVPSTTNRGGMVYKDNDKFQLYGIDLSSPTTAIVNGFKDLINKAKIKTAGVIIYFHEVTDADVVLIAEVIDYAIAQGCDVVNIPGLYTKMTT